MRATRRRGTAERIARYLQDRAESVPLQELRIMGIASGKASEPGTPPQSSGAARRSPPHIGNIWCQAARLDGLDGDQPCARWAGLCPRI